MPYKIEEKGGKWVVINADTGRNVAEHDTKQLAERQVRLLHKVEDMPEWEATQ